LSQAQTGGLKLSGAVFAVVLGTLIATVFASASLATAQPRRSNPIDRAAEATPSKLSDPDLAPEASELQAEETAEPVEPEVVFEWSKFPAVHEADLLRRWNNRSMKTNFARPSESMQTSSGRNSRPTSV
jgi:hypothetical protein